MKLPNIWMIYFNDFGGDVTEMMVNRLGESSP